MRFLAIAGRVDVSGAAGNEESVELLRIRRSTFLTPNGWQQYR
jgi:hypothetical protein